MKNIYNTLTFSRSKQVCHGTCVLKKKTSHPSPLGGCRLILQVQAEKTKLECYRQSNVEDNKSRWLK